MYTHTHTHTHTHSTPHCFSKHYFSQPSEDNRRMEGEDKNSQDGQ